MRKLQGMMRRNLAEWKSLRHLLVRDFYPLTPWHYETRDASCA